MVSEAIDVDDIVDLHAAGVRALNEKLGVDGARKFMKLCFEGHGDYTAEKKLRPPMSEEEKTAMMDAIKAEAIAAGTWRV